MNIKPYNTIVQINGDFNNQDKEEVFFTVKLVKSGLADMLWQLSLLYRIGQLCDYTYVHTPLAYEKRYELNFLGKILKKIETTVNKLRKTDKYSDKLSNFLGFDNWEQNISDKKFINCKIIPIPIDEIYYENKISNIEQLKESVNKFIAEVTPSSKKAIYCLTFRPQLYQGRRAFRLDELLNSADPEGITLKPLKLQLSENYYRARQNRPVRIPFKPQTVKIVIHLRKGDRMLVNLNKKLIGVFSSQVKVFESINDLDEWEINNYSNSNDTNKADILLQKIFSKYGKENFSVIVMSDGYERTFQNIRHAIFKGEIKLSEEEKRQLNKIEKTPNKEFEVFSKYSNVYTIVGESEKNTFESIHAIVCADIIIKTTGGFAWVLHSLFKRQDRSSSVVQLGQDDDLAIEKIGLCLANNIAIPKNS
ncbi:hypothetical protein [Nostoc sp. CCY 9925]|uniref:hypothetical protein n=1 Tax=Nostoc sp. CCY 9925 TaxID=3103865 RepID=UPI0039C6EE5C